MTTFTREGLGAARFTGFISISALRTKLTSTVPDEPGIYVLLRPDDSAPVFLEVSTGGWYQGRDPSVSLERLQAEWLAQEEVAYIGKADSLQDRLGLYLRFGAGEDVRHYGGRLIWHLAAAEQLIVAWRQTEIPLAEEKQLLAEFRARVRRYPFANLRG